MGTLVRITVCARGEARANAALLKAQARFTDLDNKLSDYKPDSELNRLCRTAFQKPVRVSRELFTVVAFAQRLALLSGGAFDATIGARTRGRTGTVGYRYVSLGDRTIALLAPDMQLDLGGLAKGFAGDEVSRMLREAGIPRHLIAVSGDIVAGEAPIGEAGWTIGIGPGGDHRMLKFSGVSTSGNESQPGHILDPITGQRVLNRASITVIADDGITADALGTACFIVQPGARLALLSHYPRTQIIEHSDSTPHNAPASR